jgi:tRNA A37 threonylcarbamoyladenosine dehydratase
MRKTHSKMLKQAVSKAAASEEARRYVPHFVGPFALVMGLGERKSPSRVSTFDTLLLRVEPLSEATCLREALRRRQGMPQGKRCVWARRGRAGEKSDCFSILRRDGAR